jgi:ligand-binding SRPBCC domain-containing protein
MIPPNINFTMISPLDSASIYPGQIIKYKVTTSIGVIIPWVTEITDVEEKQYFIDEQRMGLFEVWRHQHYFLEIPGGVAMTDILNYKFRFGLLGDIAHSLFLRRRLKKIFDHRDSELRNLFGEYIDQ